VPVLLRERNNLASEERLDRLDNAGLALHLGSTRLPYGAALSSINFELVPVGAVSKRPGYRRFLPPLAMAAPILDFLENDGHYVTVAGAVDARDS